jgi:predicted glycogen debranching enzyme
MNQIPSPGDFILKWRGDTLKVTLTLKCPRKGRAVLRTNIGRAGVRRREIIDETERGLTPLARAWTDIPLEEIRPGVFCSEIPLNEVGVFSFKACFFPAGKTVPEWPEGANTHVKVQASETRQNNSIYTVFPRQFGSFREVARRLDLIMEEMGFRIIQTLPPFPVPTTYAVMGEYGCPFAALDFMSVDPAMAEFDEYSTPLDQFRELIDAVHSRLGLFFVDLPANHTGWASTLQTHHPDWFKRASDGRFISPGAWGVTWADLVELDYSNNELRAYMAEVFLFWCRNGVDGFRCDAGYMIPLKTWEYIVSRVRSEFPATVFMLEGLGGLIETTDALLAEANLDWAYSEIFQTYDRAAFEWYLPGAIERSEKYGTLVHFAETHDNDRLAKKGHVYARLRVQLAALLSWQGAWGIANGVEWFADEKIDVHGKNNLSWGSNDNMVSLIGRLNRILSSHKSFSAANHLEIVTAGDGNTLAVVRDGLLVVANLDVNNGVYIRWRKDKYAFGVSYDLITGRRVETAEGLWLEPGEVMCLNPDPVDFDAPKLEFIDPDAANFDKTCHFHWVFPRDVKRDVCVPQDQWLELTAPSHFRVSLIDPVSGRTLRARRSIGNRAIFRVPEYQGDGTCCRKLILSMVVYGKENLRTQSYLLVPPKAGEARMKSELNGFEVRGSEEMRAILSNGSGASSQVRIGWAVIASQYDAFLAANPNPDVPSDRLNLWARTRCWIQHEGYTREFDSRSITRFEADPAGRFARWEFEVPCGMGKKAAFVFTLALEEGRNRARLDVKRVKAKEDDVTSKVRLVFRPDIEWRSFHSTTKAYEGSETLFPSSVKPFSSSSCSGYTFSPYDGVFSMTVKGGQYHNEPQWTYNVSHKEELARGQQGSGDLFSPGWISADLKIASRVTIDGCLGSEEKLVSWKGCKISQRNHDGRLEIENAMREALNLYIVKRDDLKTVIAGYPWFLDWGRDTFIFMRGMIAAGMIKESVQILKAFAAFEENGTLPNIIYGTKAGNRDTTDAQLWFIRCVREIDELGLLDDDSLKETSRRIVENYFAGTPNGICVDNDSALVWSPSHFTWMDTNYPACTPREGYPVEIQALWISALDYLGYDSQALKARASIEKYFRWEHGYRDCLSAERGKSAAEATAEDTIRPNQLFLITLGVVKDKEIIRATEELLVPGGIRSLNSAHSLYRGVYEGDEDTSRKPSYHNGTVWAWPFPLYAEALVESGLADKDVALSLLSSAVDNLNKGCLCHISENADGDSPHAQKGCTAQAWSDSEFLRVWLKLTKDKSFNSVASNQA